MSETFGLVCSGGGSVGAYQVGLLKYIHENFCRGEASPFQVFAGISCGSLNTVFISCNSNSMIKGALRLEELWLKFHVPEYSQSVVKALLSSTLSRKRRSDGRPWALLDPTPMDNIIDEGIDRENLARMFELGTTLGTSVSATEILSGIPVWFSDGPRAKSWERFHSVGKVDSMTRDHIAASCTIPFFLPARKIGEHYFVDGNINLSRPFSAAVSMGATKILCIRTDLPPSYGLPVYRPNYFPGPSSLVKVIFKALTKDHCSGEAEQIIAANRLSSHIQTDDDPTDVSDNSLFSDEFDPRKYKPIDIFIMSPSVCPDEVCDRAAEKLKIRQKGVSHGFFFHREYIRELINFGYADGKAQHEELESFFGGSEYCS